MCPHCGTAASEDGWSRSLRRYQCSDGLGVVLAKQYRCKNMGCSGLARPVAEGGKARKTSSFLATSPAVLRQLPLHIRNEFPVVLTRGTGLSRALADRLIHLVVSGAA